MRARLPIDPSLRQLLDAAAAGAAMALGPAPRTDHERALATRAHLLRGLQGNPAVAALPSMSTEDVSLGEALRGRLYRPTRDDEDASPLVLHFHGGGFVAGSIETHDPYCRLLADEAAVCVLSVDYRLAPESPYPAGLEDGRAALLWVVEHAARFRIDPSRLVVSGDSAGANLAAVLTNELCAERGAPAAQILLFPVTDHPYAGHPSYAEPGWGFGAEFMQWAWRQYLASANPDDPRISPLRAVRLPALPPTYVATAEYDILRDEGLAYADKLRAAGVAVHHQHAADMHHNFFVNPATANRFPQCRRALAALAAWIHGVVSGA